MEVSSAWEYRDISLYVYCDVIRDFSDEKIELVLWHEFMHVLVSPMRPRNQTDLEHDIEERVCSDLATAFFLTVKERRSVWEQEQKLKAKAAKKLSAKKIVAVKEAA